MFNLFVKGNMRKTIKKALGAVMAVCISGSMIYTGYNYSNLSPAKQIPCKT